MSGTLYTSRIRACSLYCPSAQRVTSITNKYIALGKYTWATRANGLWCTSAKLLLAEQTHMTHYYRALQSEQMHQNTNQQGQWKSSNARSQQWVCCCCGLNIMPHESEATMFPKKRSRVSLKTLWRWIMQFKSQRCRIVAGQENINWAWHLHADDKHIHGLRIHPMAFDHYCRKTTSPIRPPN